MKLRTHFDAVIVGGGHNGLVAAAYLARAGQSVLLLERNDRLGGATASTAVFRGMEAHLSRYSYLVSLLPQQIVHDLDLRFTSRRREIASCTPYDRDGVHTALLLSSDEARSPDAGQNGKEPPDWPFGAADWRGYRDLLELERAFAARVWPSLLKPLQSRRQWTASLRGPLERRAWDAFVERPLGETVERCLENDLLRGLVFTDAKIGLFTHPRDPTLLQNRCFILHVIGRGTGEWEVPIGGMGALVEALAASARESGAQLEPRALVETVQIGKPHHTVVFLHEDKEHTVEATRVLVNAGPQVLARVLGTTYAPVPGDEGSVYKVNMLLRRLPRLKAGDVDPRHAFAGTLHIDEAYSQMQDSFRQALAGHVPDRPPFEIYCHTLTDDSILGPKLRAAGYQTLTLFGLDMPYRLFATDHDSISTQLLRRSLAGLNRVLADPIEECLAQDADGNPCIEIKSPLDLERELALNCGNIFHAAPSWFFAHDDEQAGTWGVETPFERIYRCGSSAVRGGAVSGIPGHNAAQCIFQELCL